MKAIIEALSKRGAESAVPSFAAIERRAHEILPALAQLRPTIGATPLVAVPANGGVGRVWLKMETANATGTVKARTAYALICGAVNRVGRADVALVEYSGGSLAVALAEFCQFLGLDLHMVVPDVAPDRLRSLLRAYGATVSDGVAGAGFLGAMEAAALVAARDGRREFLLQHCATDVVAMHREQTGAELVTQLEQVGADPAAVVGAVGTGGSIIGTGLAVWKKQPECRVVAVFPAEAPYGDAAAPTATRRMNGTGGLGYGLRQPLLRPYEDRVAIRTVPYPDALDAMRHLRLSCGVAVSSSGAGAWLEASEEARVADSGEAVAIIAGRGTVEEWSHVAEK